MHVSAICRYVIVPIFHFSFFFFSGSGAPRDLHSFPTRRSSDLPPQCVFAPTLADQRARRAGNFTVRSEEHTSELQSLRHLVCRLLLEKKKKNEYCKELI